MSVTTPDPTLEFVGLFADQTEPVILARMQDWANEGLDPEADADQWVDTREGAHWQTVDTPVIREFSRLYDLAGTEVPMSGFVLWAWGTYLDDLANVWDVFRLAGTPSEGELEFSGPAGDVISPGTTATIEPVTDDDPTPDFTVSTAGTIPDLGGGVGTITLPIVATEPGQAGDVSANAIIAQSTPLPGITFTNPAPTIGGSDPETDDELRVRVIQALLGKGPGTVADYVRWASAYPGVGMVWVVPVFDGPGTVLVAIGDSDGQPLPGDIVTEVQTGIDPVPGKGSGTAPVGASVTVDTSTLLDMTVVAALVLEDGYSLDGSGVTVNVTPAIQQAIQQYFRTVVPGDDVIYAHVFGLVATTVGVQDITTLTINGGTVNIATTTGPPEAPSLTTLTLS